MESSAFVRVKIENISLSNLGFIIFLKRDGDDSVLPICVGAMEAHSIAASFNNQQFPRPLSHDLFKNILANLDCKITKIHITDLVDGTFYARIFLHKDDTELDIDSRPSDAIALALRFAAPIFVHDKVLKAASVNVDQTSKQKREPKDPAQQMEDDLQKAIADERYEDAARIRDEMKRKSDSN